MIERPAQLTAKHDAERQIEPQGPQLSYAYVGDNPINQFDPSGHDDGCEVAVGVASFVFAGFAFIGGPFAVPIYILGGVAMGTDVSGGCTAPPNQDYGVSEYGYGG